MLVDSHCHLDDTKFEEDRQAAIERALAAGVERMVAIGTGEGPPDLESGIRLAESHPAILATVGIHPEHAINATDADFDRLRDLLGHPKVIGVGEIGLDYYWQPVSKAEQHRAFIRQMEIARDAGRPVMLHTRDAWDDTLQLLREHWDPNTAPCILHCFSGGLEILERALELGCVVSFAGVVTYPKALNVQESVKAVPLDRMLVETDAPYLPPQPKRGKRNEPAYMEHTVRKIAELRGMAFEAVADATTSNFRRLFSYTD